MVKPHLMRDVEEEYHAFHMEEASVKRKLENAEYAATQMSADASLMKSPSLTPINVTLSSLSIHCDVNAIPRKFSSIAESWLYQRQRRNGQTSQKYLDDDYRIYHESENETSKLQERLKELQSDRKELDKLRSSTAFQRNLVYPLAMLLLLLLTGITVLVVVQNTLELLIGIKALPLSTRVSVGVRSEWDLQALTDDYFNCLQKFTLGITSLSKLGPIGAAIEVFIIFYLCATSTVGLYTMPFMNSICPQRRKTSLSQLIVNSALLLILSSALPLLSRILGEFSLLNASTYSKL